MKQILPLLTKDIQKKISKTKKKITFIDEEIKILEEIIKIIILKRPSNNNSFDLFCWNIDMNVFNISLKKSQIWHSKLEKTLNNFKISYSEINKMADCQSNCNALINNSNDVRTFKQN